MSLPRFPLPFWKRLAYQQARSVVLLTLSIGLIFVSLQVALDFVEVRTEISERLHRLNEQARQQILQALRAEDEQLANDFIKDFFRYQPVYKVELIAPNKKVLSKLEKPLLISEWRWISDYLFADLISAQIPIFSKENQGFASLNIQMDAHHLAMKFLERSSMTILSEMTRNLILAIILLFLFHFVITKPILRLTKELEEIDPTKPELTRLQPHHQQNEFGELIQSINNLLQAIDDKRTERERILAEVQAAKETAEIASRTKSDFLANMSHELRTPLNAVMGMLSLTLDTQLTSSQREYLEVANYSADNLLHLISDLLDFSKLETGRMELEYIPFNPRDIIEVLGENYAEQAHTKALELAVWIDPQLPLEVYGDPSRFQQIISNLLNNAIKFTDRGGVFVSLTVSDKTAETLILNGKIQDTGIGIPPELQQEIFGLFTQVDSSSTRAYGGLGLGLALTQRLLHRLGGEISLTSEINKGSTFIFTLPTRYPPDSPYLTLPTQLNTLRLLLVSQHTFTQQVLQSYTAMVGINLEISPHLPSAINDLRHANQEKQSFDAVLLDLYLSPPEITQMLNVLQADTRIAKTILIGLKAFKHQPPFTESLRIQWLTLPLRQSTLYHLLQQVQQQTLRDTASSSTHSKEPPPPRILLVEDNLFNQKVALNLLKKLGIRAEVANNGLEALEAHQKNAYDLIFMDCQMPIMDGFNATLAIRDYEGTRRHTLIIALTANMEDQERCIAAQMDDYLTKPYNITIIANALRRWLPQCVLLEI